MYTCIECLTSMVLYSPVPKHTLYICRIPLQNSTITCIYRFLCIFPDMRDVILKRCDDYLEDVWTDHNTRFLQVLCSDSLEWEGGSGFYFLPYPTK